MKLLIVADRPVIGAGISAALAEAFEGSEARQVTPGECARQVESWGPDLAVVDVAAPRVKAGVLISHLHENYVHTVSVVADSDEGLTLLQAGADGIVTSGDGLTGVLVATRTVLNGHTHVPSALLGGLLHGLIRHQRDVKDTSRRLGSLSSREREVLALLGDGHDQGSIARKLQISPQTAKTHIRHVLNKLGVHSRIEAAALASELGLTNHGGGRERHSRN